MGGEMSGDADASRCGCVAHTAVTRALDRAACGIAGDSDGAR